VLLLTGGPDLNLYKSGRNLPKVSVIDAASASTLDVLGADVVLFQEEALTKLTNLLGGAASEMAQVAEMPATQESEEAGNE